MTSFPLDGPDYATIADDIGLTTLRTLYPSLTGAGITVGQVEGSGSGTPGGNDFEVDPASLGHPAGNSDHFFTYYSGLSVTYAFNDGVLGTASAHATTQASFFYNPTPYLAAPEGVAPGVAHVDNYNAQYFLDNLAGGSFPDRVVNLSVVYASGGNIDATFDAAANRFNTIFVAAAGNGGAPGMPSSAYNVISVDTFPGIQAIGPAVDGAPKPDISAPQTVSSRATPIVSGAATLLVQAGSDGIGGSSNQARADSTDFRTIKALLLNGAAKPADYYTSIYAPTATDPLNAVYGAGVVNVANSVATLAAGEVAPSAAYPLLSGTSAFQSITGQALSQIGWTLATLTAQPGQDAAEAYAITLTAGIALQATLTWAASNTNTIDHLDLYLYDDATGALLASSTSPVSNVQQLAVTPDHAGRYDLVALLHGATDRSLSDRYALAFATPTTIACFAAGTRILTATGEIHVEQLRPGDLVVTLGGRLAPIRFIGRRHADPTRSPNATPIRVRAHAIAPNQPHRDLLLSPDHAIALHDAHGTALIPAHHLLNHVTITRGPRRPLTYFHVELAHHALILAEGLATETYLDTGNRSDFANAADAPSGPYDRTACAPLVLAGPRLTAHQARLAAPTTPDPAPLLHCDGTWLSPTHHIPGHATFAIPPDTHDLRLISRTLTPAPDPRTLGLPITRLARNGSPLSLSSLASPYPIESQACTFWRWTDGTTRLAIVPADTTTTLDVWWMADWPRYSDAGRARRWINEGPARPWDGVQGPGPWPAEPLAYREISWSE